MTWTGIAICGMVMPVAPRSAEAATGGIAFVDPDRVFDSYEKTKQLDKQLEGKWTAKQAEREKLVTEIKKMRDELELMTAKAREDQQASLTDKMKGLQEFDRQTQEALKRERNDLGKAIVKEIERVVQAYAQQHGYTIVVSSRAVLYGDKTLDITDPIIKTLNGQDQKG